MTGEPLLFEPIIWHHLKVVRHEGSSECVTVVFTEQSLTHIVERHVLAADGPWAGWWGTTAFELAAQWYKGQELTDFELNRLRHELEGRIGRVLRAALLRPMVLINRRVRERWLVLCPNGALLILDRSRTANDPVLYVVTAYWPHRSTAYWHPEPWRPAADALLARHAPFSAECVTPMGPWTILTPETWGLQQLDGLLVPTSAYPEWPW